MVLEEVHDLGGSGLRGHDGSDLPGHCLFERERKDMGIDPEILNDPLVGLFTFPDPFDPTPVGSDSSILEVALLGAEIEHGCCAKYGHNPNNSFYGEGEKYRWAPQGYLKACGQQ